MSLLLGLSAQPAFASINVTTTTDEVQNNGQCSLREAITEANSSTPLGHCFDSRTNPNLINVPAGTYTLIRTGTGEDANSTGDLDVSTGMTIQGAGAATTTIDGNRSALTAATSDRVFDVSGSSAVAIDGVKITDGGAPTADLSPDGGGIRTAANLTLSNDVVTDNHAGINEDTGRGGGIFNTGTLTLYATSVDHNRAGNGAGNSPGGAGGGIQSQGTLTISASTIADNFAGVGSGAPGGSGGGISAAGLVLTNSTVSNNAAGAGIGGGAGGSGGGVYTSASSTLTNDTLAANAAGIGSTNGTAGAILVVGSTPASLANTILAASPVGGNCAGPITDSGHNLSFGGAGCPAGIASGDPNLGPLQDNGGPTLTMAISAPSAALDQVPPAAGCPAVDQRGIARPQGSACDIGAFELAVAARYGLSVSKSGTGAGTVTSSPAGIGCGPSCNAQFDSGTSITLSATPDAASTFAGWSGAGCSGAATCTFVIGADTSVAASFKAKAPPNTKISKASIHSGAGRAKFSFKATGGSKAKAKSGFQCALVKKHGKTKFKSCGSPKRYKHLEKGKYTFEVRAFDSAGKDSSPAKSKFKIK